MKVENEKKLLGTTIIFEGEEDLGMLKRMLENYEGLSGSPELDQEMVLNMLESIFPESLEG